MNAYRQLVFSSFKRLSPEQYARMQAHLRKENLIPQDFLNSSTPASTLCLHLESVGLVNEQDVRLYIQLFRLVDREDLAYNLILHQKQFSALSKFLKCISYVFVFGNRTVSTVIYTLLCFAILTLLSPTVQIIFCYKKTWLSVVATVVILTYYNYEEVRDYFRYLRCTYGCVPESIMSFQFTGMNLVTSDVV